MNFPSSLVRYLSICIFMLGSYFAQGQIKTVTPPEISKPVVSNLCLGLEMDLTFSVTNGYTYNWLFFVDWYSDYIAFSEHNKYEIILEKSGANPFIVEVFEPGRGTSGNRRETREFNTKITLPPNFMGNDFSIKVKSTNPSVTSPSSNSFNIYEINSPTVNNNGPICVGGTLRLTASPIVGAAYTWSGPGLNTTTTNNILERPDATAAMAGKYTVTATANGCTSEPANTEVKVDTPVTNNHISLSAATSGSLRATANENGNVVMNAPAGTVFTDVQFASYGTPTDDNGSFKINSNCHAQNSKSIVESYLLGRSTATIPATNAVFTDPCVGTRKRLYVQATYQATATTICSGTNPGIIPGSTPHGGTSNMEYLWESSTTGSNNGFSAASGTNNTKDYNPGNLEETTWFRRRVLSQNCEASISNAVRIDVKQDVKVPTASSNGPLCIGATLNLYATEVVGATYQWTGPNNYSSTLRNPVITNVSAGHAGTYSVKATVDGCTSKAGNTTVTINPIIPSTGNDNLAGTDSWIGHVYDGTNFGTYMGTYTEPETFVQGFGGNEVCFGITSNGDPTSVYTETFSVRYLNNSTKNGLYIADLTSDDGIRLKINGEIIHDNWIPRSPTTDANVLLNLSQQDNLLTYEYYENSGGNVVQFQNLRKVTDNTLTGGTNQTLCEDETAQLIVGDAITLVSGITTVGTGYQWVYSKTVNGDKIVIPGATQKDFTPDLSAVPFNEPGKYFIFRQVSLKSINNRINGNNSYSTTHTSTPAEVVIGTIPQVELTANPLVLCETGDVEFSAFFTGSGSYLASIEVNGISMGSISVSDNKFVMPYTVNTNSTFRITSITDQITGCINNSPNASVTIEVDQPITSNTIASDQELCGNENIQTLTGSTPQGGSGTFIYEWLSSTTGPDDEFSSIENTNNKDYTPGTLLETTWFKRKVTSGVCEESISGAVKITVYDEITNNTISYSGETNEVCLGNSALEITGSQPTGGNGEFIYHWESSISGPDEGFEEASGTNTNLNYNPGTLTQTTWFRRIVNSGVCGASTSNVIKVSVNPLPKLTPTSGDTTICLGQTVNLSGTLSGKAPWMVRGTINGAAFSVSSPSASLSYPFSPTVNTTVKITSVTDANGCTNNEVHSITITVSQQYTWTGAADTNWNNPNNWSCNQIPTLKTDVLIPNGLQNYPKVNSGQNSLARNLTIESGASVLVNGNWIRMVGNLVNAGVFNVENGSVSFEGTTAQQIPSAAFLNDNVLNLNIKNPAGVSSLANINILNSLKVEQGNFNTGNALLLVSNEAGTAYIDGSGAGSVSGSVTMQRYLANAFGYKYFSSPFQNSSVEDLAANFELQDSETGFPHLYQYLENRKNSAGKDLTGWEKYLGLTNSLQPGYGYAINPSGEPRVLTLELSEEVSNGPVTVALQNNNGTYTNGFNLVGNPYPSPIDWNLMLSSLSGIDNAIHFFTAGSDDRYTGTYTSYIDGISTDGRSSSIIPSMQGFFVRVSDPANGVYPATTSLEFNNAFRVGNQSEPNYYRAKNKAEVPQIKLTAGFAGEEMADATVIYFKHGATPGFEKEMDAQKLLNTAVNVPSVYSLTALQEKLSINAVSGTSIETMEIPMGISAERSGEMRLSLAETTNLFPSVYIYLKDNRKNVIKDLDKGSGYTFTSQKGQINDRFVLMFSSEKLSPAQIELAMEDFTVYTKNEQVLVRLNLPDNAEGTVILSSMAGQVLQSKKGSGKDVLTFSGMAAGIYLVTLETEQESQTKKVIFKE